MADEEKITAEGGGGAETSSAQDFEDISWEDAAADLEKQKEMLKAAAEEKKAEEKPVKYEAPSGVAVSREPPGKIDLILDIPLQVTVELGRTKMLINDLLQLGQGSVIELTKLIGEPLEVLVNDKLVAKGEVVVVNEKFGIRLTDIVSPTERVESLK